MDKIDDVLEYDNGAAIVHSRNNGSPQFTIFMKDGNGWLLPNTKGFTGLHSLIFDKGSIAYRYINDYSLFIYMAIAVSQNELPQIEDKNSTEFHVINSVKNHGGFIYYYAFIKYTDGYYVKVNGKEILVK